MMHLSKINSSVQTLINKDSFYTPTYIFNKDILIKNIKDFQDLINAEILYSVKSNPEEKIIKILYENGVRKFDIASLNELELLKSLCEKYSFEKVDFYFMHPVKSRKAINEAYKLGVRVFSLDSKEELYKILEETNYAKDLSLHLRVSTTSKTSAFNLSNKFGISLQESETLIKEIKQHAQEFGICFHVGSQCMNPSEYVLAIDGLKHYLNFINVTIDVLDIGGGYPLTYHNYKPLPLNVYAQNINYALAGFLRSFPNCKVWSEPGRVLVGESQSLLTRVELVKGKSVYINDGTYGGLFDAGYPNFVYGTTVLRSSSNSNIALDIMEDDYQLFGPTCDSLDIMKGPFKLPKNITEGDYILFHNLGAYSKSLRTNFNGFNNFSEIDL